MGSKKTILAFTGLALAGGVLLLLKKLLGLHRETFHLYPASASTEDLLRDKNFGEFPVEIPEYEFESWGK